MANMGSAIPLIMLAPATRILGHSCLTRSLRKPMLVSQQAHKLQVGPGSLAGGLGAARGSQDFDDGRHSERRVLRVGAGLAKTTPTKGKQQMSWNRPGEIRYDSAGFVRFAAGRMWGVAVVPAKETPLL